MTARHDKATCVESDECVSTWHYWRCPKHDDYGNPINHDKATALATTVREVLDRYVNHERSASFHVALDALEAQATGRATEGRTGAAAVDQAIAEVRTIYVHPDEQYLSIRPETERGDTILRMPEGQWDREQVKKFVAALRVLADAVERRDAEINRLRSEMNQ